MQVASSADDELAAVLLGDELNARVSIHEGTEALKKLGEVLRVLTGNSRARPGRHGELNGLDGGGVRRGRDSPGFGEQGVDSLQRNNVSAHTVFKVVGSSDAHG